MATLKQFKDILQEMGELMIMTDTGDKFELHKHNVKFDEKTGVIEIDASSQTFWLDPEKISYYWIHKEAKDEK